MQETVWYKSRNKSNRGDELNLLQWMPIRSILKLECPRHRILNINASSYLYIQWRNFRAESFQFETRKMCKRVFKLLAHSTVEESIRSSFTNMEAFIGPFDGWKVYPQQIGTK